MSLDRRGDATRVSFEHAVLEATTYGANHKSRAKAHLRAGGVGVIADVRIDNVPDLQTELGCSTDVDGAVLLALAYKAWGPSFAKHLKGDFAFVLWDDARRMLVVGRDAFGVRPLVYWRDGSNVFVASSEEALLALPAVSRVPDEDRVVQYLLWEYREPRRTFFRDIKKVPPGHFIEFDGRSERSHRHWHPPAVPTVVRNLEEHYREYRRLFEQAVERRLRSEGSVVAHVSGGLDSSSIICVADALVRGGRVPENHVIGAAAVHPGLECDESEFVRVVADHVTVPIQSWDGTKASFLDLESPGLAAPASRIVMTGGSEGDIEIANREAAGVLLSGIGGDQLGSPLGVVLDWARAGRWLAVGREVFADGSNAPAMRRLARAGRILVSLGPQWGRSIYRATRQRPSRPNWLSKSACKRAEQWAVVDEDDLDEDWISEVARAHWAELASSRVMAAVDRIQKHAGSHGLEARFPFLDQDLVSYVLSLPFQFWPPPRMGERLHRDALRQVLPTAIAERRTKTEYTPALVNFVRRARDSIRGVLWNSPWESGAFVSQREAQELSNRLDMSEGSAHFYEHYSLWAVVTLEAWLRRVHRV